MGVKMRQEVERKIAVAAIKQLLAAGFVIGVNDGEETTLSYSRDAKKIEAALFTTDEDHLLVYEDRNPDASLPVEQDCVAIGWVRFIYGNSGWDVLSDYSTNLEQHLTEADKIANHYSD